MNLGLIFLTGLTTGGLTCLAVQGGLLATAITKQKPVEVHNRAAMRRRSRHHAATHTGVQLPKNLWPVAYFLSAKLVAYTILGFLLGALGSVVQISPAVQAIMMITAGLFMLATALNMLNVHPIFRYVVIQPPKFLTRLLRDQSRSEDVFAPVLLGAMTVFIPCGTTQAMEVYALTSGLAVQGMLIMAVFILGTMPTFFVLGFLATQMRGQAKQAFALIAAILVLGLGAYSVDSGLKLANSPFVPSRVVTSIFQSPDLAKASRAKDVAGVQQIDINVLNNGYSPNLFAAEAGKPIRLVMVSNGTYGCTRSFTIPSLGVSTILPETGQIPIDIPPQEVGTLHFTCGMGMYGGEIIIY